MSQVLAHLLHAGRARLNVRERYYIRRQQVLAGIVEVDPAPDMSPSGTSVVSFVQRPAHRPLSPTSTNGAHIAGCAYSASPLVINSAIERRSASARPIFRLAFSSAKVFAVSLTAAFEFTYQCDTNSARVLA